MPIYYFPFRVFIVSFILFLALNLRFFFNVVNIEGIRQQAAYFDVFIIRHISYMINTNPIKIRLAVPMNRFQPGQKNEDFHICHCFVVSRFILPIFA